MIRICFVCLGNICRSPTAEGVMRHLVASAGLEHEIEVDSAGTAAYHAGEQPDRRSRKAALARGIALGGVARQFVAEDYRRFDYVLAVDASTLSALEALVPAGSRVRPESLLRYDRDSAPGADVPDPYYGGGRGFERVLDLCEAACRGLLDHLLGSRPELAAAARDPIS